MAVYSIGKELAAVRSQETGASKLQEQVTRLVEEARSDVYRYLLTLGISPPQAQEATQEVFLRLYGTLRKGETIRNPRAWIFRVAHNHGLKIRARRRSPDGGTPWSSASGWHDFTTQYRIFPSNSGAASSCEWKGYVTRRLPLRWGSAPLR